MDIKKRIEELQTEMTKEQGLLNQHNQAAQQISQSLIAKQGAIYELGKLIEEKPIENKNNLKGTSKKKG